MCSFPPIHFDSFSFYWREKKNTLKYGLLIYCVFSIDCLASDFANFLDVRFWSCTKEPHFLLESGPGERQRQTLDPVSTPWSFSRAALTPRPVRPVLPPPLYLPVNFVPGARSSPELTLPALSTMVSTFRERDDNFYTNTG